MVDQGDAPLTKNENNEQQDCNEQLNPQNGASHESNNADKSGKKQDPPHVKRVLAYLRSFVIIISAVGVLVSMDLMSRFAVLTTLERRFGFPTLLNGIIVSCYDVGHVVLLCILSYAGSKVHRPRMVAVGGFLSTLSGILWAMPHFIFGPGPKSSAPIFGSNSTDSLTQGLCQKSDIGSDFNACSNFNGTDTADKSPEAIVSFVLFSLSMCLLGAGLAPFLTVAITYLDDNTDPASSALGVSIFFSVSSIGLVLGFLMGAGVTSLPVDLKSSDISPNSQDFIGAYWLGPLCIGILVFFVSLPLMSFPPVLQPEVKERKRKITLQSLASDSYEPTRAQQMRPMLQKRVSVLSLNNIDVPKSGSSLLRNIPYITTTIGMCAITYLSCGMMPFIPKFLETQFAIEPKLANILTAVITAVAIGLGTFTGGWYSSAKKLTPVGSALLTSIGAFFAVIFFTIAMFLGCPQPTIGGTVSTGGVLNVTAECNLGCSCVGQNFNPVCGSDGINYYSACNAGCQEGIMGPKGSLEYTNCSCVVADSSLGGATSGICDSGCFMIFPYAAMIFLCCFCVALGISPSLAVLIRCVEPKQKSLALGINNVLTSVVASIPAPMLYGKMIDSTCAVYSETCDDSLVCLMHDTKLFRYLLHGVTVSCMIICVIAMMLTWWWVRKMDWSKFEEEVNNVSLDEKQEEIPMIGNTEEKV